MRSIKLRILSTILLATFLVVLVTPTEALAVVQSLNGQTGQTQTFQNDTNVTISSSNNIHSLGWQGLLGVSRGGTGASSFTSGSLLFSNGTSISQDNSSLFWDDTNNRFGIGTTAPTTKLDVVGDASVSGNFEVGSNVTSDFGLDKYISISSGGSGTFSATGFFAGETDGTGGAFYWQSEVNPADSAVYLDSLSPIFISGSNVTIQDDGSPITLGGASANAIIDTSLLTTSDKTFAFPNTSGTLGLLEVNQTWNGLNKFEASNNSTIYVGSSVKSGCIAMGDSDDSGVTYVTANDGVLSASAIKPSICQ